jgi:hypothetical protein
MINIEETIRQLAANVEAICALVQGVSEEQARWKPAPGSWSLREVMEHLHNEERGDFRAHLQEIFSDPPQSWGALRVERVAAASCRTALDDLLTERQGSLVWLASLRSPDWERKTLARLGPTETMRLSAGDVLASWVAHDYLHIRQINELLYAWNVKQASPYSVEYAGEW